MTRATALVLPSAPVLVPGVTDTVSAELAAAQRAVRRAARSAPRRAAVMIAPGEPGVVLGARASLRAAGRDDLARELRPAQELARRLGARLGCTVRQPSELALGPAVLALLGRFDQPIVTVQVPTTQTSRRLRRTAERIAVALREAEALIVTAAGDGAAALAPSAPLTDRPEAHDWQRRYLTAVQSGDAAALATLGPGAAARVGAQGWAPAVVLICLVEAGLVPALQLRYDGAPHGVGYVVAG